MSCATTTRLQGLGIESLCIVAPITSFGENEGVVTRTEFSGAQLEVRTRAQAAVAARQVRNALSRRTRSVRREVRWRWTLKVLRTTA
jgi:hypothetical protein